MYGSRDKEHDRHIFCHSGFYRYYNFTNINDSHMMNGSWDKEHDRQNFLSFWTIFLPFYPPKNPKNQNFEKMKKLPGDIFILHKCKINDNHMIHGSWDTERDGQNFLSFWTIFCPFTSPTTQKIKIWKNEKNTYRYYHFTELFIILDSLLPFYPPNPEIFIILQMRAISDNHMIYGFWANEHNRQYFLSFWTIFCTSIPLTTQKIKILKKWTKHLEILSFYTSEPYMTIMM